MKIHSIPLLAGTLLILVTACFAVPARGFDYVLGTGTYSIQSQPKPVKGQTITDLNFHTNITRVTDSPTDKPGQAYDWQRSAYPTASSANIDDTYILTRAHSPGDWNIYYGPKSATPYQFKQTIQLISASHLPENEGSENAPYWSSTDPDKIYLLRGKYTQQRLDGPKLYSYKVSTDTYTVVHDFTNDPGISKFFTDTPCGPSGLCHYIDWGEYSGGTIPQRYWAIPIYSMITGGAQFKAVAIYDMQTDTVVSWTEDPNKILVDVNKGICAMTPSETYIMVRSPVDGGNSFNVMDHNFNVIWNFISYGHADTGMDSEGRDVMFGEGFSGGDTIAMVDLTDGTIYGAADRPCTPGGSCALVHYSGHSYSRPGWGVVSVEDTKNQWFDAQIYLVELDRNKATWKIPYGGSRQNLAPPQTNRVWRIAHHHGYQPANYDNSAMGTISLSGDYIYYKAQWESSSDNIEVYQISLPSTWYQDLSTSLQTCSVQGGTICPSRTTYTCSGSWVSASDSNACCIGNCQAIPSCTPNAQITSLCMCGGSSYSSGYCCSNTWQSSGCPQPTINKFIAAYNFADSDIPFIASHFGFMDTSLDKASQVQQIKSLNPSFKAIFYRDALTYQSGATEDWYVHDVVTGSRVVNKDWGWYLMDIGNPNYRTSLTNYIRNTLDSNQMFDGVFLDDVWTSMSSDSFYRDGTTVTAVLPQSYIDSFHSNMVTLLSTIKSAVGSKLVIPNTGYAPDYASVVDGQMYEAFCHANWQTFAEWYSSWQLHLDNMINLSNSGKIYLAQSGIFDGATQSQINQTERYCLAMYFLGSNRTSYFNFIPAMTYQGITYFPEWDLDIGTPTGSYQIIQGTNLYQREYSKGLVMTNPSAASSQANFGGYYKTIDGNTVNTLTLASHQGEVLQKIISPQTCSQFGGSCCLSSQTCTGSGQFTSDCPGFCCAGGTCSSYAIPTILKTSKSIVIDGNISEFLNFQPFSFSDTIQDNSAKAYLAWDNTNLYLAFNVTDRQLNAVTTTRDGGGIWQDDAVELFIDTLNNDNSLMQTDDYQFMINLNNAKGDLRGTGSGKTSSWNSGFSSAVIYSGTLNSNADTDSGYAIELSIPWSDIGGTPSNNTIMAIDLNIDDKDSGSYNYFDWAGIYPNPISVPSKWRQVKLLESYHKADNNPADGCISQPELTAYINRWKMNNQDVTMPQMMDGIKEWKRAGC